ncbi:Nuclear transport factor 2 (NTF2) family protein with RNA binding (RRM-RBD-RNP motifs) domain [Striga hermonthica]|uniref:Nuclear transport factor 2 (NTF2) family protein with RNA binding (RRM-RBD-RNP motifs) domain n=1 Tax=Striga hermonthica TaxID=68872 RepID=A0A9N7NCB4_STRHE|nr:Nuclear transport factor 2 (NTF2) family protein with RNA binding (RRM-RBD-RNP motifs) domain [Striga hermonthica]
MSKLGRPEADGSLSITTTMQAINEKIVSLNYENLRAEIKSVDALESYNGGVNVLVTGHLTGQDNIVKNFAQSFFLAPQDRGFFVLNDMFRYVDNINVNPAVVSDVVVLPPQEQAPAPPVDDNHTSEQSTPSAEDEAIAGEVYNPPENGNCVPVAEEEEVPVPEVVDAVQDDIEQVVVPGIKSDEVPKKSYASIVKHLKETAASFSPPPVVPRKAPPTSMEQVNPAVVPTPHGPVSSFDSVEIEHDEEEEGMISEFFICIFMFPDSSDGYSIYVKGLPMNATEALLEEVFKKFGTIKKDGIQVRSNKQQVFCFGFVEFEEASSAQKALEASPVLIGGRQAIVEEKRSTNSRGSNRGRFHSGRGSGFRGRGNYGGGGRGGYNKGDFNGIGNKGNRGDRDGYQRSENSTVNGARTNRMLNANVKNPTPRIPSTA